MSYYLIRETLTPCKAEDLPPESGEQYAVVLTSEDWQRERSRFDMGIEWEPDTNDIHSTKAEVNYGSLTGTFRMPNRDDLTGHGFHYAFALDEKGVVFIDDTGTVEKMLGTIAAGKRWREPCLERFLYDFLELIVSRDLYILEHYEKDLDKIEEAVLSDGNEEGLVHVKEILSVVRKLCLHYDQLTDMAQVLDENENGFFVEERLRYMHLFMNRMSRLQSTAVSLREHSLQVRDLYSAQLEVRQNRIMTLLTVVTTIFMPLTLIVGWYGMNFRYMPELEYRWAYPVMIVVSVLIVVISLLFFKKKKWM